MVDEKKIAFNPAYELSFLKPDEQQMLVETMDYEQAIISFDPRDGTDNGLTVDRAQELGEQFCKEHFPGHQALVCTHPDGHNHSGNMKRWLPNRISSGTG